MWYGNLATLLIICCPCAQVGKETPTIFTARLGAIMQACRQQQQGRHLARAKKVCLTDGSKKEIVEKSTEGREVGNGKVYGLIHLILGLLKNCCSIYLYIVNQRK